MRVVYRTDEPYTTVTQLHSEGGRYEFILADMPEITVTLEANTTTARFDKTSYRLSEHKYWGEQYRDLYLRAAIRVATDIARKLDIDWSCQSLTVIIQPDYIYTFCGDHYLAVQVTSVQLVHSNVSNEGAYAVSRALRRKFHSLGSAVGATIDGVVYYENDEHKGEPNREERKE